MPAARDSSISAGISSSVGCGGATASGFSRSTPITSRRSCSASRAVRRITAAASAISSGGASGPELERARVHAQQRQPVREHVVHLARDPPPLGLARLLDVRALLGLELLRALVRAAQEVALRAGEQAPGDHQQRDHHAQQDLEDVRDLRIVVDERGDAR